MAEIELCLEGLLPFVLAVDVAHQTSSQQVLPMPLKLTSSCCCCKPSQYIPTIAPILPIELQFPAQLCIFVFKFPNPPIFPLKLPLNVTGLELNLIG